MKIYQLVEDELAIGYTFKKIEEYNPFKEYFLFDKFSNSSYILRSLENSNEILVIALNSFTVNTLDKKFFNTLPRHCTVVEVPYYSGGCCDYTSKIGKEINEARIELFQKVIERLKRGQ